MLKGSLVQEQVLLHFPDKTIPYRLERRSGEKDSKWLVLTENGFEEEIIEDTPSIPSEPITPEPPVEPCNHEFQYIACCENGHRQKCTICNETTEMEPHDYGDGEEFCKVCGFANPDYTPEPILVADALVFNGQSYFELPYSASSDTKVEADVVLYEGQTEGEQMLCGSRQSLTGQQKSFFIQTRTNTNSAAHSFGTAVISFNRDYMPYNSRMILIKNGRNLYKDSTLIHTLSAQIFDPPTSRFLIGALGIPDTDSPNTRPHPSIGLFRGKIYSFKIYDNDNLVHDLIPIAEGQTINKQTATANGFYDKVNDTIFYSMTGVAPEAEVHYEQPETKQLIIAGGISSEFAPIQKLSDDTPLPKKVYDIFLDIYPAEGKRQYRARDYSDSSAEWIYSDWFHTREVTPSSVLNEIIEVRRNIGDPVTSDFIVVDDLPTEPQPDTAYTLGDGIYQYFDNGWKDYRLEIRDNEIKELVGKHGILKGSIRAIDRLIARFKPKKYLVSGNAGGQSTSFPSYTEAMDYYKMLKSILLEQEAEEEGTNSGLMCMTTPRMVGGVCEYE